MARLGHTTPQAAMHHQNAAADWDKGDREAAFGAGDRRYPDLTPVSSARVQGRLCFGEGFSERGSPRGKVTGERLPGQGPVDLVVLMNEPVAIRDGVSPEHAVRRFDSRSGEATGASPSFIMSESPASCSNGSS